MYSKFFKPFPTLETERLILRKLNKHDAEDLYEYCKSYKSAQFSKWQPHESVAVTKSFISYSLNLAKRGEYFTWGIILKSTGKLIGTCSYNTVDAEYKIAEIGYGLIEKYQGQGYAREAVGKILEYGFCTVGLMRMAAQVVKENASSINLLEALGFECEGLLKNGVWLKDTPADVFIFGMTDAAYCKINNIQKLTETEVEEIPQEETEPQEPSQVEELTTTTEEITQESEENAQESEEQPVENPKESDGQEDA